jgi:polyphenol oxidase
VSGGVAAVGEIREIREEALPGVVPLRVHPEWLDRFPWLVQGTTWAGAGDEPFDLGLSGEQPVGRVLGRWRELREGLGLPSAVHARQVHGAEVRTHRGSLPPGLTVMEGFDGHLTELPGVLLTVSVADCIPISLVDPGRRTVALLHGGWRGVAGGIVERALSLLADGGAPPASLVAHAGPAICGGCYEVGPEVHAAIHPGLPAPPAPMPIDLRAAVAQRLRAAGVPAEAITLSAHCTRCGEGFFSHRAGSAARQMGVLAIRA